MSVFIAVYGLITGADMNTWFSQLTSTAADYIIRCIAVAICFIIGLVICRKCTPLIVNMSMKLKLPLFMGTALPVFIFMVMEAYSQSRCISDAFRFPRYMLRNTADTDSNITPYILYKCIS